MQSTLETYFITKDLYLWIPNPYFVPLPSLYPLVTTDLFATSMSLFLCYSLCYMYMYMLYKYIYVQCILCYMYYLDSIYVISYSICLSLSHLFHLALCPSNPSMLLQMAKFHSFLWLSSIPLWRRQWHPTPVLLPGKSHGRRSLVGYSPWGRWELDPTERLHFHFSLSCIGEGNGKPLQCSCLENPRDAGAWWAAVSKVAQSRTRLKRLSSSSSSMWYTLD